jgi:hypothetical protein
MKLINNSRFGVTYTVTLSTPHSYTGQVGEDTEIPPPVFSVEGDAGQLGKASAQIVPSNATVTFTVEGGTLHMQVEYSS